LVVVTLAAILLGLRFGLYQDWLRERREFLAGEQERFNDLSPRQQTVKSNWPEKILPTAGHSTRWLLWYLGEQRQSEIVIRYVYSGIHVRSPNYFIETKKEVTEAARLFPEATIKVAYIQYFPSDPPGPSWGIRSWPDKKPVSRKRPAKPPATAKPANRGINKANP